MARNSIVDEGQRISIYISKEVADYLSTVENVSDYIRRLVMEATDMNDKIKVAQEITRLKERRAKLEGELGEIDAMLKGKEQIIERVTHNESHYSEQREAYMKKWSELNPKVYHGSYWPNLDFFITSPEIWKQDCGFKSEEEAFNWFNEHRPKEV